MIRPRVIPCLLLRGDSLVKTIKFKNPQYVGDAINTVRIFNQKEVDELLFLDIGATVGGAAPPFAKIEEIACECFMPFGYGGGIRSIEDMQTIFSLGVEKIVINSFLFEDPAFARRAADKFGSQSVIASIDVDIDWYGRYRVCSHGGRRRQRKAPVEYARELEANGVGEILLTAIHRDGTWQGFDVRLVREVSDAVSVPVIAAGGAGNLDHLAEAIKTGHASALGVGSMVVYQGKGKGVLVRFPTAAEIDSVLSKSV